MPSLDDHAIARAAASGRSAWPGVSVSDEVFGEHLRRLGVDPAALARHGDDLYLACACARGDEAAVAALHTRLLPALEGHLRRLGGHGADLDDLRQLLLVRLLAAPNRGLVSYAGRSPLIGWLRTIASRTAFDARRAAPPDPAGADRGALDRLVSAGADPELATIRQQLQADFQQALEDSLAALSPRARTVLRMHYIDGLNIDAIGEAHNVHRATVARWINGIRSAVMTRLRERVTASLRPTSSELRSLTAAVRDDLHISVDRVLGDGGRGEG
jgi:RNA polymerase sigma-70 factor (ECF subfamily)